MQAKLGGIYGPLGCTEQRPENHMLWAINHMHASPRPSPHTSPVYTYGAGVGATFASCLRSGGPSHRPSLWARAPSVLAPRTPPPAAARLRTGHVSRGVRRVAVPAAVPSPSAALDQPAGGLGYLAQWSRKITSCTLLVQDRWAGVARSPGAATRTLMDDA